MIDDDDDCGVVGEMRIGRGKRSTRRKFATVPLCPSQIPHDLGSNPGRCCGNPTIQESRKVRIKMKRNDMVTGGRERERCDKVV
jgi:hypothetical protein